MSKMQEYNAKLAIAEARQNAGHVLSTNEVMDLMVLAAEADLADPVVSEANKQRSRKFLKELQAELLVN